MSDKDEIKAKVDERLRRSEMLRRESEELKRTAEQIRLDVDAIKVRERVATPRPLHEYRSNRTRTV